MHAFVPRAFHEVGRPAVSSQQTLQFLVTDARQHRGIVDLVAIQMEDRQDGAIANGAQKLIDVPGSRQGSRFRFAVADHCRHDQFRIIERRPASVREHIPKLSSLMNRARRFRRAVAPNASGKRELLEEFPQAFFVFALVRVHLGVAAFQIDGSKNSRGAMPRPGQKDHVLIVLLDLAHQVNVGECQAGTRTPMPQEAVLDVFRLQGLPQQWIFLQIEHAQDYVSARSPKRIGLAQLFGAQGSSLDRGSRFAKRTQRLNCMGLCPSRRCHREPLSSSNDW